MPKTYMVSWRDMVGVSPKAFTASNCTHLAAQTAIVGDRRFMQHSVCTKDTYTIATEVRTGYNQLAVFPTGVGVPLPFYLVDSLTQILGFLNLEISQDTTGHNIQQGTAWHYRMSKIGGIRHTDPYGGIWWQTVSRVFWDQYIDKSTSLSSANHSHPQPMYCPGPGTSK